jgi:pyruvate dehydrogenase E2 component (dihydrolipoamide acetyltransferase)
VLLRATVTLSEREVSLAYRRCGTGAPVVLIHGLGASSTAWHYQAARLATSYEVFSLDLPGFGGSPALRPADGEAAADAVAAFIREVVGAPAAVVGHSMGGAVALLTALRHPGVVRSLGLVSAAGLGRELPLFLRLLCLPGAAAVAGCAGPLLLQAMEYAPAIRRRFTGSGDAEILNPVLVEAFQRYRNRAAIREFVAGLRAGADFRGQQLRYVFQDRLHALDIPVLIVWGRDDRVLPLSHGRDAVRAAGDRARLAILDCGHSPMLEAAAALTDLLYEFLTPAPAATAVA